MANVLNVSGCEKLTEKILDNLYLLIQCSMSNDYGNAKQRAKQIEYDAGNLLNFMPAEAAPQWLEDVIGKCSAFSKLNTSAQEYGKYALEINNILFCIKNFSWSDWNAQFDYIDLDKEFSKEAAAAHLDDAIDQLIVCLNIIANDPEFNLSKQTKIDIETLVDNLGKSKHSSQSAIRSWMYTAEELVKLCIPHMDKVEKGIELLKKTEAAFNEVYVRFDVATFAVAEKIKKQFCFAEKILPPAVEVQKLSLPLTTDAEAKQ